MKAVFLDRDGVINKLVYHEEQGVLDSPFTPFQYEMIEGVPQAIKRLKSAGYAVIVASNQPGVAKGHYTIDTFWRIQNKMHRLLRKHNVCLDAEYYCLHHPESSIPSQRECGCRKPKPGMLLKAQMECSIDMAMSWMVGDGLTDVQTGKNAGTRTILIGKPKCESCQLMDKLDARPDYICKDLGEATDIIIREGED